MSTKSLLLSVMIFSLYNQLYGQEIQYKNIYIETGMELINCAPPDDKTYIRGDVDPQPSYYEETSYMMSLLYKNYFGIKGEIRVLNNKLGLASGLRYTRMVSSLGKNDYWTTRSDFLYLLYKQDGTTTEYLKIKDITQISNFLGIPLELRIYPYAEHFIQLYYKIGTDLNLLLKGKTDVQFVNSNMQKNEGEVDRIIEDPWKFYASLHLAICFKIGKPDRPGVNIEACVPSVILSNNNSSFVTPYAGGGLQLNLRIPF